MQLRKHIAILTFKKSRPFPGKGNGINKISFDLKSMYNVTWWALTRTNYANGLCLNPQNWLNCVNQDGKRSYVKHMCIGEFPNWKFNIYWLKLTFQNWTTTNLVCLHSHDMLENYKNHSPVSGHFSYDSDNCLPHFPVLYTRNYSSYSVLKAETIFQK